MISARISDSENLNATIGSDSDTMSAHMDGFLNTVVQSDYEQNDPNKADYIKNRPFYTGGIKESELADISAIMTENGNEWNTFAVDESNSFTTNQDSIFLPGVNVSIGETYTFLIDSVRYEYQAKDLSDFEPGLIGFGDTEQLFAETPDLSSIQFIAICAYEEQDFFLDQVIYRATDAPSEVKFLGMVQEIKEIDLKYIPKIISKTVNEAKEFSESANANAANAVSTANTAKTNAANAVSTANTAKTNAANAVSTANSAKQIADETKSLYESFPQTANEKITEANTASTNAAASAKTAQECAQAMAGTFDFTGYLRYQIVTEAPTNYEDGVLYIVQSDS